MRIVSKTPVYRNCLMTLLDSNVFDALVSLGLMHLQRTEGEIGFSYRMASSTFFRILTPFTPFPSPVTFCLTLPLPLQRGDIFVNSPEGEFSCSQAGHSEDKICVKNPPPHFRQIGH